ncbi:MAG: hypothetical protein AB7O66_19140 [Limisphaerales bacterium]
MKTPCFLPLLLLAATIAGCATPSREQGNLARHLVANLQEYGADFPHIDLTQPAIGIPQLHTSWKSRTDPGGFVLEFRAGTFDYVEHQVREIAGRGDAASPTVVVWDIQGVAHLDLVQLADGRAQLTCRRVSAERSVSLNQRP